MKFDVTEDGLVLSEVCIRTPMGLFGIAQRDDGIEVMLDGKTVWTSHELPNRPGPSGAPTFPLKADEWIIRSEISHANAQQPFGEGWHLIAATPFVRQLPGDSSYYPGMVCVWACRRS